MSATASDTDVLRLALRLKSIDDEHCQAQGHRLWQLAGGSGTDHEISLLAALRRGNALLEAKGWTSSAHPRAPTGSATGGQFVSAGTSSTSTTAAATEGARRSLGSKLTPANIKRFQKAHGLLVDGKIGRQTAAALLGEDARKIEPGPMTADQRKRLEALAPKQVQDALTRKPSAQDSKKPADRFHSSAAKVDTSA